MKVMTEEELLKACEEPKDYKKPRDVTVDDYSHGKWLRKFAYYPKFLPIYSHMDHGIDPYEAVSKANIEINMPSVFFFSPDRVNYYKKNSNKTVPAYQIQSPFLFCRKYLGIEKDRKATGTLAFPAHNITSKDKNNTINFDIDKYISDLKSLPDKYQPISVCMYWIDIKLGRHKIFLENGFNVYTAGNIHNYNFIENYYAILKNFKYATSNTYGSYAPYSVEMSIPFFLYGERPDRSNFSTKDVPKEVKNSTYSSVFDYPKAKKFFTLFGEITDTISPEQKAYIDSIMPTNGGVSRLHASYILYTSFLKRKLRIFTKGWLQMKWRDLWRYLHRK